MKPMAGNLENSFLKHSHAPLTVLVCALFQQRPSNRLPEYSSSELAKLHLKGSDFQGFEFSNVSHTAEWIKMSEAGLKEDPGNPALGV